eukprot:3937405-Rhodomonas_salina.3
MAQNGGGVSVRYCPANVKDEQADKADQGPSAHELPAPSAASALNITEHMRRCTGMLPLKCSAQPHFSPESSTTCVSPAKRSANRIRIRGSVYPIHDAEEPPDRLSRRHAVCRQRRHFSLLAERMVWILSCASAAQQSTGCMDSAESDCLPLTCTDMDTDTDTDTDTDAGVQNIHTHTKHVCVCARETSVHTHTHTCRACDVDEGKSVPRKLPGSTVRHVRTRHRIARAGTHVTDQGVYCSSVLTSLSLSLITAVTCMESRQPHSITTWPGHLRRFRSIQS